MTHSYSHIYLSPHYDDAALSCGGAIHQQVQAGEAVLVITICAAPPLAGEPLSPFARSLHHSWGDPPNVVAARRAEDQASMGILGADFRRLDVTDCIYRGHPRGGEWYYTSKEGLFGQVHPAEQTLVGQIAATIIEQVPDGDKAMVYAPLTVGHHVDHQVTHEAAWQLQQQGWTIAFYEDYPYADPAYPFTKTSAARENPYALTAILAAKQAVHLQAQLRFLSAENLQAKINSVRAYASQLPMLFGSETKMANYVGNYTLLVGEGKPAERIWLPQAGRL